MRRLTSSAALTLVILLAVLPEQAAAFVIKPIMATLAPSGPGASYTFEVENNGDLEAPIEFTLSARTNDIDGKETLTRGTDVEKQWLLYPPQMVLKKGEKRAVRVSWIGDKQLKSELAFRMVAEQLPVKAPAEQKKGGQIKILMRYVLSLYVAPPEAKSALAVKEARTEGDKLVLLVANDGTAHQVLTSFELKITPTQAASKAEPLVVKGDGMTGMAGENLLAGSQRRFVVPMPKGLSPGPVKVDLELK